MSVICVVESASVADVVVSPRWTDVVSEEVCDGFHTASEHCCPTKPVLLVEESLWPS